MGLRCLRSQHRSGGFNSQTSVAADPIPKLRHTEMLNTGCICKPRDTRREDFTCVWHKRLQTQKEVLCAEHRKQNERETRAHADTVRGVSGAHEAQKYPLHPTACTSTVHTQKLLRCRCSLINLGCFTNRIP